MKTVFAAGIVVALVGAANAQIADGGFEAGPFGGAWTEFSTNFGSTVCDIATCGQGGGTGPGSGTYWSWFGGIAAYEAGSVSQSAVFASGMNTLTFIFELPVASGDAGDYLNLSVDGNVLWTALGSDATFVGYQSVSVDVSAFADGGAHTVSFDSEVFGNGGLTNFFVDDVALVPAPSAAALLGLGGLVGLRRRR